MLHYLLEFIIAFILVYLYYRIFVLRKKNKFTKVPMELQLFVNLNNLDIKKLNKRKVMQRLSLLDAFLVAVILLCTEITDLFLLKLLLAFVLIFVLMIAAYKILGSYYQRKGFVKNV